MKNENYKNFIGIDVSKNTLDFYFFPSDTYKRCKNTSSDLKKTLEEFEYKNSETFVVFETTGGYEQKVCDVLLHFKIPFHRANTRHAKHFVRSLGQEAKTDKLDAKALCLYGVERHSKLPLYQPITNTQRELQDYAKRRSDLKAMLVKEKNRLASPSYEHMLHSVKIIIKTLEKEISRLESLIEEIINSVPDLQRKVEILKSFKGVGPATVYQIIADLPELGTLKRRSIAALAGVAPYAKDSGTYQGLRHIRGGRQSIRSALFMAVLSAVKYNVVLKSFYQKLISNGKKPMVAITACMRKMIVILNAMLRDNNHFALSS